jgi:hypothetical protein
MIDGTLFEESQQSTEIEGKSFFVPKLNFLEEQKIEPSEKFISKVGYICVS